MQDRPKPPVPLPHAEGERRKEQDRRQHGRAGKYERRKNRCIHCIHFQEEAQTGKGLCQFHQLNVVAYAFACPNFAPLLTDHPPQQEG